MHEGLLACPSRFIPAATACRAELNQQTVNIISVLSVKLLRQMSGTDKGRSSHEQHTEARCALIEAPGHACKERSNRGVVIAKLANLDSMTTAFAAASEHRLAISESGDEHALERPFSTQVLPEHGKYY